MEHTQWEYKMASDRGKMHRVSVEELNELGKDGWELVYIAADLTKTDVVNYFFKRIVQPQGQA